MVTTLPPAALASFGALLKHLRRRARLTQRELSIAVGYSEAQISRLEQSQRLPDLATLAALFVPALGLEAEPDTAARLLALAAQARGEPPPTGRLTLSSTVAHTITEEIVEEVGPGRWPPVLTSFVGRAAEVAEIARRVRGPGPRLTTLTGPGGAGKTRLALAAVTELAPPDGVWWVDLAALTEPAQVAPAVAAALGIKEGPGCAPAESIGAALRAKTVVVVLDNCEHLLEACAVVVAALLAAGPGVRVLATSREPLNVAGEAAWPVPLLAEADAVRLFSERARAVDPRFDPSPAEAAAVARLCRQLDGLPLAIELAAARTRALTPTQIEARLSDALALLTSRQRGVPARQQTLHATLEWSARLLTPEESGLLARLAVFAGSFALEAVEQVAGPAEPPPLERLTGLVDKSLVLVEPGPAGARYRLLEVVRQYAAARLADSDEAEAAALAHAGYYLALAEAAEPELWGGTRAAALAQLEPDHANLHAALAWARTTGRAALHQRLCAALIWYWHFGGFFSEAQAELAQALRQALAAESPAARAGLARAQWGAGLFAWIGGDYPGARAHYTAALAHQPAWPPTEARAHMLSNLGMVALGEGQLDEAQALTDEALAMAASVGGRWAQALLAYNAGAVREAQGAAAEALALLERSRAQFQRLGDRWGQAIALVHLGLMAARQADYARAQTLVREALAMQQAEADGWGAAAALALLGQIALAQGAPAEAWGCLAASLALLTGGVGDRATLGMVVQGLGLLAWRHGDTARAAEWLAAAQALHAAAGGATPISLSTPADVAGPLAAVRAALAPPAFEAAGRRGLALAHDPAALARLAAEPLDRALA